MKMDQKKLLTECVNSISTDQVGKFADLYSNLIHSKVCQVINENYKIHGKNVLLNEGCDSEKDEELTEADDEEYSSYKEFFAAALEKFDVKSPAELEGDKKKEFYDYIDSNWKADKESD